MKIEQLRHIIAIEKYKSVSKAAKALYMGQPSLSGSLNSLEKRIGVQIFNRSAKGVEPTEDGKEILHLAHQIVNNCDQILQYRCQNNAEDMTGTLKIMISPAYSFLYFDILTKFRQSFPKVDLQLSVYPSPYIVESFGRGECNIAVEMFQGSSMNLLDNEKIHHIKLKQHEFMLFVGNDCPFYERESVDIEELREQQFVAFAPEYWAIKNKKLKIKTTPYYMSDDASIIQAICRSDYVAILPDTFDKMNIQCDGKSLRMIPVRGAEELSCNGYIFYSANRRLTLLERMTIQFLKDLITELE